MSILAQPKYRQKLSIDPRNLEWKNDQDRVSVKMMEKMGWKDGHGLGKNKQGDQNSVKLKANYTGRGLGADKLASYDSTWIGHHDDFADLLSALNKNKTNPPANDEESAERAERISMELKSKSVRRRIHYQKFTRAKDTANYSEQDRTAILGLGLKRTKDEDSAVNDRKGSSDSESGAASDNADSAQHTVSNLSVKDYFAAKMAALRAKALGTAVKTDIKEEIDEYNDGTTFMKEQHIEEVKEEIFENVEQKAPEEMEIDDEEERRRLKKERKRLKKLARQQEQEALMQREEVVKESSELPDDDSSKKRKKRSKVEAVEEISQEETESVEEETEKQRRKREKRERKLAEKLAEEAQAIEDEVPRKKSKKSKN